MRLASPDDREDETRAKKDGCYEQWTPPVHQAVGHGRQASGFALFLVRIASCLGAVRVVIAGGDHAGSFGLGSLPRIVAACPGNWSRHESLGSFGVKRMSGRVPGVAVIWRGMWQQGPMGGYLGPIAGALTPLVAVLAGVPTLHLWG